MRSILIYAILLAFIFSTACAVEKTINWSASKRYPKMNARVGDTVKFVYEAGAHNVVMPATKRGYRVGSTNHKRKPTIHPTFFHRSHRALTHYSSLFFLPPFPSNKKCTGGTEVGSYSAGQYIFNASIPGKYYFYCTPHCYGGQKITIDVKKSKKKAKKAKKSIREKL